jgi:DNA-binding beta-propeller fold protein YncE
MMLPPRRVIVLGWAGCVAGLGACFDPDHLPAMAFDVVATEAWQDGATRPTPAVAGEVRLVVTNNLDDTVSVVSWNALQRGGDGAEVARFPVGLVPLEREGPHHVDVDDDGRFAFVGISNFVPAGGSGPHGLHGTGSADGRVLRVDLDTQQTVAAVRVDKNPGDVRLSPNGTTIAVTHFDLLKVADAAANDVFVGADVDARIAFLDPITMQRQRLLPVCPAPHGMAFGNDGRLLVTSCLSDEAAIVDVAAALAGSDAATLVRRVTLLDAPGTAQHPNCSPYAVTMTADDSTAWISCYASGDLVAVDTATATRGRTLALPGLAVFGDVSDAGDRLAIATQDTDGIVVFDVTGPGELALISFFSLSADICPLPHTVRFLDDDDALAVVCEGNKRDPGAVVALDADSGAVLGRVVVGRFPDDIAVQVKP